MSLPIQYTPSTITLFLIDSLMGKCHNMLIACTTIELKYLEEEFERQQEAQHPFYLEQNQFEYQRRWEAAQRNYDAEIDAILNAQPNYPDFSGDAALDDDVEWCSEMEDCLLPAPEEELYPTEELTDYDSDDSAVLSQIDFSEEINLNDLY